ncbi:MAG: hypothetical protein AAFZ14_02075 [Pseudomonadota bacterium]
MGESTGKSGLTRALDAAQKFWPVTLLLMALTMLSQFDTVRLWSDGLAFVIVEWRMLMTLFWEYVNNLLRRIVGLELLTLSAPIPEVLTFASLFLTSFRLRGALDRGLTTAFARLKLSDRLSNIAQILFGISAVLLCIVGLSALLSPVINPGWVALLTWAVMTASVVLIKLCKSIGWTAPVQPIEHANASFWIVTAAVVLLSGAVLVASYALELLVVYVTDILGDFAQFREDRAND